VLRHHLGLIVPEPAQARRIRVSDEVRHWRGRVMLADGVSIRRDRLKEHPCQR
jgi:aspartyl/asparaginyl beta-hydroxylase (cupin superfamily)